MGAQVVHCSDDSVLYWEWARASRALGYGEQPGMHTEEQLQLLYGALLEGLEDFGKESQHDKKSGIARAVYRLQILEFEIALQSLLTIFPPEILRGKTKKECHDLFLNYSARHPETIWAREEREATINRMDELGMIRKEWFGVKEKDLESEL